MIACLLLIIVIWTISKLNKEIRLWWNKLIQQPFNYYLLIGLLIIGFFFELDNSDRYGCIIYTNPFRVKNILFFVTSIILVLLSFFSEKRTIKLTFMSLELTIWILKLFLFKGGYVVGIVATVDTCISFYDTATLALRLTIINSLLNTKINQIYILICTAIIMSVKIYAFRLPYSFYVEERKWQIITENTKNFLTKGEWIENKNMTEKIQIIFFPENAVLYNFHGNDTLFFNHILWGEESIFLESWVNSKLYFCTFEFKENGKDTLNVNFRYKNEDYTDENYRTQMIRK